MFSENSRVKFHTAVHKTKGTLSYIHSYVWGPSKVPSKGGARSFVSFIDDDSIFVCVYT